MDINLKMDKELRQCIAYIQDELKDAIVISESRKILDDDTEYTHPDDTAYYVRLKEAARVYLEHFGGPAAD